MREETPPRLPVLFAFAARAGVPPLALLHAAGLDPATAAETGVPRSQKQRLWDAAVELTGDQDFGLHLAEWVSLCPEEHMDVLAYAVRSCATLGEHYRRMGRYVRLLHEGTFLALEEGESEARLVHGLRDGTDAPRQPVECMLALAVLQGRRTAGDDLAPRAVCFAHAGPARPIEQERLFRAPVRYGCPRNELVLDRGALDRPQLHAEPRLLAVLDRRIEEMLNGIPEEHTFSVRVKRAMADHLMDGDPPVGLVAGKLHMSPRSLQRRLQDEGTSFARLLSDLRCDLAKLYLRERRSTLSEVAFLLGFAEVSAFHRAFKRWTGQTPAEYRRVAPDPSPEARPQSYF